jgi:predicted nucleic acid-binding protein
MKRTYIDANVLIAAFQGEEKVAQRAFSVLDDPNRKLVVSDYLRLEVLPKPMFHKRREEVNFMEAVFENAENWETSPQLTRHSLELAAKYDMAPMDALHVGAAVVADVDELVTLEKPTKPICKVEEVAVKSIASDLGSAK